MKKCKVCGTKLTRKSIDIDKMLNQKEAKRLEKLRLKEGLCSECSMQMLMMNILN